MHLGERWANGAEANFAVPHLREASGSHMSGTSAGPARTGTTEGNQLTGRDVARDGQQWPLDRAPLPLETSMPGVFAVGDVRCRSIKRVASAVGDGATAVRLVHEYLAAEHADEPALAVGT